MFGAVAVSTALRFHPEWCEDVRLADGITIRMRQVRPTDREKLIEGLARLSPESQYLRFFTTKVKFTEAELRYLTEIDGYDHFAIVAAILEPDGTEGEGVAIGRFVRLHDEPTVAEPAIVVVDAMQHRGIGRLLMERLIEAAVERGIRHFRSEFLAINRPMKELLAHLSPAAQFITNGPVVTAEFALAPEPAREGWRAWPIYEWFRLAAQKGVALRRQFDELLDPEGLRTMLAKWRPPTSEAEPEGDSEADADGEPGD
jgi:GNAT superfamily N-acetyltransferase